MDWTGKKVFLRLRVGKVYSGVVQVIDIACPPLVFITIRDKFNNLVTVVHSEITEFKEE